MKTYNIFYILAITLVASLGGLLFGYDTAVISGADKPLQIYLINSLRLGALAHGATISSALIGCIIGGMLSGVCASRLGRRNSLLLTSLLFIISGIFIL
jgi:SP family xylose:H+ symportor-like MFS transporter